MTSRAFGTRTARVHQHARAFAVACAMLKRFDAGSRPRVAALVTSHAYFEDLMWSFPAVLHALALACEDDARAADARALIVSGAPLRKIAETLKIPMWARALQAEAFSGPLPELPDTKLFELKIANHIPNSGKQSRQWLAAVASAFRACDEDFALWVARNSASFQGEMGADRAAILGLYAWHSARPLLEASHAIERCWKSEMSVDEVSNSAGRWLGALQMPLYGHVREARLAPANHETIVNGIEFVRLRTPDDLIEEGHAMNHCVATYVTCLAKGCCFIYSLRENGRRVATLEVRFPSNRMGRPTFAQVRAANNAEAPHHVWAAMHMWLAGWRDPSDVIPPCGCARNPDPAVWRRLWKPYWMAKGLTHFLGLQPPRDALRPALEVLW